MTMHLVGPYMTTTNYRKRKTKVTKAKMAKWEAEYRERCKFNKRLGLPKETFEEYLDIIHGRVKQVKQDRKFIPATPKSDPVMEKIKRHKEMYPSLIGTGSFNSTAKKEPQKYTGTLIKGIATMHKSNAVPVIDEQHMKDIARMRR